MWSDNESLKDYIDYRYLVKAVTSIIDNESLLPCSIGIFGDWGSGKSSLMRMVEATYKDEDILVIGFNGWLFEGYEDAKTVLMARIVDEIIAKRTLSAQGRKYAARLLKKIDLMKLATTSVKYGVGFLAAGPVGIAAAGMTDIAAKLKDADYEEIILKRQEGNGGDNTLRTNIQEFHSNFENLINETRIKKIVVLIDDLDRCSPDTVIGTLEAIKLFLFTKKTAFVIGADERLIKYAVKRRFPEVPGENLEVGRDYLEKLIQYPIRIPALNTIELTTYVNLLFSKLYSVDLAFEKGRNLVLSAKQDKGVNFVFDQSNIRDFFPAVNSEFEDALSLCSEIVPVLATGLNGNPRQTKRFLNAMLTRIEMANSKGMLLKRRVLAKLMLLEYFKPETFTFFHDLQAQNGGSIPLLSLLENEAPENLTQDEDEAITSIKLLRDDKWVSEWSRSEPKLAGENLQPYFYFSRDRLTITAVNLQRMTPQAQEAIQKLLSSAQAVQTVGIRAVGSLSSSEAASIFEALTQKVRSEENLGKSVAFKMLFGVCREKAELRSQMITFLQNFPVNKLPMTAVALSEGLLKNSHPDALEIILSTWGRSTNKKLANVIKSKTK
jgi:predicted KAP-like P-loop ATPase